MGTINISEDQVAEMKSFYQEELVKAIRRLNHIQKVLHELGDSSVKMSIQMDSAGDTSGSGSDRPVSSGASDKPKSSGKKRGPKSIWGDFILKRMRQLDKPLTYNELVDEAMVYFKLNENRRQSVINAINNSAFRLRKNTGKIDTFGAGSREKYVALRSWFDENGKIKKEYLKRISKPKRSTNKKTAGEPGRKSSSVKVRSPKMARKQPITASKDPIPSVKVKSAEEKDARKK